MDNPDEQCPYCGEPISATAIYCMHCYEDLPQSRSGTANQPSTTGASEVSWTNESASDGVASESATDGWSDNSATGSWSGSSSASSATGDSDARYRLHPEGLADNSLTVIVGVLTGSVFGALAGITILFILNSALAIPVAIVVWLAVTVHLARRPTLGNAVKRGTTAIAIGLLLVPTIVLSPNASSGSFAGALILFLFGEFVFGAVALVVLGVGWLFARTWRVD